ncbi:MAG: GDSL-type esterase/lipase family protein [Bacteroidota bacterium]|nr:GDSL-type esterase/lipase family protein [Bacteroidota bacterium]
MRKHLVFILICLSTLICFAQQVEVKRYDFIDLSKDTIAYYGNSKNTFNALFDKFRSMITYGQRQINILHLGDSHLQADLMSGETRKNFQSFFPGLEGSRGMVSTYMKSRPDSYKITYSSNWSSLNFLSNTNAENKGLWGVGVYTNTSRESISINVNNKNPIKYDFNSFRVYHSELPKNDNLKIKNTNIAYQETYNKKEGYTEFLLSDYVSSIEIEVIKEGNDNFYIYGFYFQNGNSGVVYNVAGVNGARASHYNNAELFHSQLKSLDFDFIIISLGTNDTYEPGGENTFEKELLTLVKNIRKQYPYIPILLTTPTETWWHRRRINPRMAQTIKIINSVAEQGSCAVLDLYNIFGGYNSAKKMQSNNLMQKDLIHLTAEGYVLAGDLIYNALWQEIDKNLPLK